MIVGVVIGALVVASVIVVSIFVIKKMQNGNKEEFERKESSSKTSDQTKQAYETRAITNDSDRLFQEECDRDLDIWL